MPNTAFAFSLGLQPSTGSVLDAIGDLSEGTWETLLVAVAYATEAGVQQLVGELEDRWPNWTQARKRFLVGLDFGLTEPRAIEWLHSLPNAECRIYEADNTIACRLLPTKRYHPKVYCFGSKPTFARSELAGGVVGSPNLTAAGLLSNFEGFVRFRVPKAVQVGAACIAELRELERSLARQSLPFPALLSQYDSLRRKIAVASPGTVREPVPGVYKPHSDLSPEHLRALRTARFLWTDTRKIVENLGAGRPGNQVDLKKGARVFFGVRVPLTKPTNSPLGEITTTIGGHDFLCGLRYGDNSMDKVNLPRPGGAAPSRYDRSCLRWERLGNGRFALDVDPKGTEWKRKSAEQGTRFKYAVGGREWGFYS